MLFDTTVTNIVCDCTEDKKVAKKIEYTQGGVEKVIELTENDLVICTNGCQGDASAYGDNTHAPVVKVNNRYRYCVYLCGKGGSVLRRTVSEYLLAFYARKENRGLDIFADCNALQ